jgi:hypothetical protein
MVMRQKNFRLDPDTQQMLKDVHWFFENDSITIRVAIRLLYLLYKNRIEINWKNETPITW